MIQICSFECQVLQIFWTHPASKPILESLAAIAVLKRGISFAAKAPHSAAHAWSRWRSSHTPLLAAIREATETPSKRTSASSLAAASDITASTSCNRIWSDCYVSKESAKSCMIHLTLITYQKIKLFLHHAKGERVAYAPPWTRSHTNLKTLG